MIDVLYEFTGNKSEKDENRSGQIEWRKGNAIAQNNAIEFAFWRGNGPASEEEQNAAKRRALKELQEFAEGEKPTDELALKIHQALNNRSAKLKLTIVTIDPEDKTASFSGPMRQLAKFLPKSRERFLTDAISHLKGLTPKEGELGAMYGLCHALVKARKDAGGSLDPPHETILAEISADKKSPAGRALRSAEHKLDSEEGKTAKKELLLYDSRVRGDKGRAD